MKKGFTLIEVMISASILALLTAIVFANINQGRVKAAQVKADVEMKQVHTASELYKSTYNRYPVSNGPISSSGLEEKLVPEFISKLPVIPELVAKQGSGSQRDGEDIDYNTISDGEVAFDGNFYHRCGPGNTPDSFVMWYPKTYYNEQGNVSVNNQLHSSMNKNGPFYMMIQSNSNPIITCNDDVCRTTSYEHDTTYRYCIPQF